MAIKATAAAAAARKAVPALAAAADVPSKQQQQEKPWQQQQKHPWFAHCSGRMAPAQPRPGARAAGMLACCHSSAGKELQ